MIASSRSWTKPLPLHASSSFFVSSSRMTGISFCGVLGWRTRSIGERVISCSSSASQRKNCCSPLCLFNAVEADRVAIIHAWNASTCARVTAVGSSAASSASGSGEYSARYRPSWAAASR
jgi:hypothetical protein